MGPPRRQRMAASLAGGRSSAAKLKGTGVVEMGGQQGNPSVLVKLRQLSREADEGGTSADLRRTQACESRLVLYRNYIHAYIYTVCKHDKQARN